MEAVKHSTAYMHDDLYEAISRIPSAETTGALDDAIAKYVADGLMELPSAEAVSREEYEMQERVIEGLRAVIDNYKTDYERFINARTAETEPIVIRSRTLMPTKDFKEWAKRVREENPNVIVIPCDAEVVSADAVSREEYEETDGVITIEKQSAKDVGEIKHIVIHSPNYTRYFYNESMPTSAEAVHKPDYSYEADMVKRLRQAVAVQGWIPCSERLPEVGKICLLTVHEYGWNCEEYTRVIIGEYSDNYADHILAWMPLPEPYKQKTERRG